MDTAMWKKDITARDNFWRLQTEEPKVIRKLRRRKNAEIVAWSINSNLVIFELTYLSQFKARKGLERLTGRKSYYLASEHVILTENCPKLTSKNNPESI